MKTQPRRRFLLDLQKRENLRAKETAKVEILRGPSIMTSKNNAAEEKLQNDLSMASEKKRPLVQQLRALFVNRDDCYCVQCSRGYVKIDEPLTDVVLEKHLRGEITVGSYQLNSESFVRWLCFDLDPEKLVNPKETAKKIIETCLQGKKIWPRALLLEASRYPDPSYHVWVFFLVPIPAQAAQWLGKRILTLAELNPNSVEIFPKQGQITKTRPYGNFVKLPLGKHQVAKKWSRFLDFKSFEPLSNDCLFDVYGLHFSDADLVRMELEHKTSAIASENQRLQLPRTFKPLSDSEEEAAVIFLCKYWQPGYRNRLEMSFLGLCLKKGVSRDSARRIISEVTLRTEDGESQSRLELVNYHYKNRLNVPLKAASGIREILRELKS